LRSARFVGRRNIRKSGIAAIVLAGALAVMLPGLWAPGPEFDEGILLAFPTRILDGDLPYRDFETFYGPAGPYLTAAVFAVFDPGLLAERTIGLVSRLLVVLAVMLIARRFGRLSMACCGIVATILMAAPGVWADNAVQAQACVFLVIILVAHAVETAHPDARASRIWFAAGVVAGCAGLFRWEFAPIAAVVALPYLLVAARRARTLFVAGLAVGLAPFVPVLVAAGGAMIHENLSDLRATSNDRRLPLPALSSESGRLLVVTAIALVALWFVALRSRRVARGAPNTRVLLSLALFGLLQVPIALSRLDAGHVLVVAVVALAFAPVSAAEMLRASSERRRRSGVVAVSLLAILVLLSTPYGRIALVTNARIMLGQPHGGKVTVHGRTFVMDSSEAAADLQAVVSETDRIARPGSRLFVGPRDLRRAYANDVFVYYLLRQLEPASFYLELDPPFVRHGSRLVGDVATADYLILTTRWDTFHEPNASTEYGSPEANQVVRRLFCPRLVVGTYTLFEKCE
jgi:hypothetical protein